MAEIKSQRWFGWKPDLPDPRDFVSRMQLRAAATLPEKVDLRDKYKAIPMINQGALGSCTACAISVCHMACQVIQNDFQIIPSKLFIYYNERAMEGTIHYDSGAMIRDGIKSVVRQGVCDEKEWPYNINKFRIKPPKIAYKNALSNQALLYERLRNSVLEDLMIVLANGYPFVFGFTVYESLDSRQVARTGIYNPDPYKEDIIGGHAVTAYGYDKKDGTFLIRNSWGSGWGQRGYFKMKFEHVTNTNMAEDFWLIRTVE